MIRILYVEDNPNDQSLFGMFIQDKGLPYDYHLAGSVAEGKKILKAERFDVVFMDYDLGDGFAFDLFNDVSPDIPIVMLTGIGDENVAVESMKKGAADYVIKDIAGDYLSHLAKIINEAIIYKRSKRIKVLYVEDNPNDQMIFEEMVKEKNLPYDYVLGGSVAEGKKLLGKQQFDVILFDFHLGDGCAFDLFKDVHPDVPIVLVTGTGNETIAVQAIKYGATDYLIQDMEGNYVKILPTVIEKAIHQKRSESELKRYYGQLEAMVEERTRELEEKNEQLQHEIQEREHAEKEKEKLEIQLRQSQKMEAVGTLAGGIAHDLNNILYPIIGYTEMICEDAAKGSIIQDNAMEVLKAAERGKDMVKHILTFSRHNKCERKPLRIQSIVKEALKLLRVSLPATIEIQQNINPECGPVMADSGQIHQVIVNLCTNAYHAMRTQGGVIEVGLDETEITPNDHIFELENLPGDYLRLSVSDTGCGMNRSVVERIFDPYFTTKARGKGTGLGLSVTHGIVKGHNGHISAYSEPGRGSKFDIYLPLIKTKLKTRNMESEISTPIQGGKERILLVDDDEQVLEMVHSMLEWLGYRVSAIDNPPEVLEIFRKGPENFDLVISDQTMPKMTGAQLAEKLMEIRPDIPIIICTGFSEILPEEKAKAMGIREYLMKPLSIKEIGRAVRRALDN